MFPLNPNTQGFPTISEQNKAFETFQKDLAADQKKNQSVTLVNNARLTKLTGSTGLMKEEANDHEKFIRQWFECS